MNEAFEITIDNQTFKVVPSSPFGFMSIEGHPEVGRFTDKANAEVACKLLAQQKKEEKKPSKKD